MRIGTRTRWTSMAVVAALGLGACAEQPVGETTTGFQLPAQPVAMRIQLADAPAAAPAWRPAAVGSASFAVTSAVINVRRVEFQAPPGLTCRDEAHEPGEEAGDHQGELGTGRDDTRDADAHGPDDATAPTEQGAGMPSMAPEAGSGATRFAACVVERARGDGDDDHGAKIRFEGPFAVDLLTGLSNPPLDNLAVPVGVYKRIDLKIDAREDEEQALPAGVSFVGLGSLTTSAGVTVAVELYLEIDEDLRLESARGITIDPEGGEEIVVRIAATDWFAGVAEALEGCVGPQPATTTVVIDDRDEALECEAVAKQLKENFKRLADEDRIAEIEEHDPDELREREHEEERERRGSEEEYASERAE